ncbi:MAG: AbrB/MazE/SpoVT family DNA-binding domain-containing protein [Candidatus Nanosalina sp.]
MFTTSVGFSARIDSKGRVTVPARIRNRLDLEKGDELRLSLESCKVLRKEFSSKAEALEFLSGLEDVKEFSFSSGVLEVVLNG